MHPKTMFLVLMVAAATLLFLRNRVQAREGTESAWEKIEQGALLLDVRTAAEFQSGHLEGAVNIPYDEVDRLVAAIGTNTAREVVLYCRSGRRSGLARQALVDRGYTAVVNGGAYGELRDGQPAARKD